METVLLGFCLISLALSSVIVLIELVRDRIKHRMVKKQKERVKKATPTSMVVQPSAALTKQVLSEESVSLQKKARSLELLDKQLVALGYVSIEQQLGFINWALNSQRKSLNEIDGKEIRHLFKTIRRYSPAETPNVISPATVSNSAVAVASQA